MRLQMIDMGTISTPRTFAPMKAGNADREGGFETASQWLDYEAHGIYMCCIRTAAHNATTNREALGTRRVTNTRTPRTITPDSTEAHLVGAG